MKLGMQQCDGNRIGSEAGCPLRAYAFSHSERDGVMETPFASMLNNLNRVSNPCESELELPNTMVVLIVVLLIAAVKRNLEFVGQGVRTIHKGAPVSITIPIS